MPMTQLGLHGPQTGYGAFLAKTSAIAATPDITVIVPAVITTIMARA